MAAALPPSAAEDRRSVEAIAARMAAARPGTWLPLSSAREEVTVIASAAVKARPARVFVMTDHGCGSSCEQFVLVARQNPRVTVVGRPTHGSLDASNLRVAHLPSGALDLAYATTYVRRPRGQEIDEVGIPPAIALPEPRDDAAYAGEVEQVRRLIER